MPRSTPPTVITRRRDRLLRIAHAFGLAVSPAPDVGGAAHRRALSAVAGRLAAAIRRGQARVCLLTGPSGSGKSTLLRAVARRVCGRTGAAHRPARALRSRDAVALLSGLPLDDWLAILCACGLAEARLWLRPAGTLSTGQSARLAAALCAARALRCGGPLILDDLGDHLDAPTRLSLACALARWCRRRGVPLVIATVHEDVARTLIADEVVRLHPPGASAGVA